MSLRRKKREDVTNHERWLVSYADLMTLLFAFFVVMYAISSINEKKFKSISDSISGALSGDNRVKPKIIDKPPETSLPPIVIRPVGSAIVREHLQKERVKLTHLANDITAVLAPLVKNGKVRITQTAKGVTVEINASVLFGPGDASLSEASINTLRAVATVLKDDHHNLVVEGHTDSTPISNNVFPSNWELSSVRASRVVRLFSEEGVAESRMVATGRAATSPVADNGNVSERSRNRRVSIIILSDEVLASEVIRK